jgi:type I restriction enzyme S subunit
MLENKKGIVTAVSLPPSASVPSFEPGEILISNIRPYFKKIWLATFEGGRSPDVLGFRSRHPGTSEYLFNFLYRDEFFGYMMLTSKGAKMPRGDKEAIMQYADVIPPVDLMQSFSERVRPFYILATSHNRETKSLTAVRETLLPKLLSGELSVPQALEQLTDVAEAINS